jgi:hypothetical protein
VAPPIREGAFVLTNFPYGPPDRPDVPGPKPHIGYCLGFQNSSQGLLLMLAYTSSGPWRPVGRNLPLGVVQFDRAAAQALNQAPFHLELRGLARVPATLGWLPRLDKPDVGVIAWADKPVRDRIADLAIQIAQRRPEMVDIRGLAT